MLAVDFDDYGVELSKFFVTTFMKPEDDPMFGLLWETKKYRYTLKYYPDLEDRPIISIQMFNYKYDTREKKNN